jgi:hypothetical protein
VVVVRKKKGKNTTVPSYGGGEVLL